MQSRGDCNDKIALRFRFRSRVYQSLVIRFFAKCLLSLTPVIMQLCWMGLVLVPSLPWRVASHSHSWPVSRLTDSILPVSWCSESLYEVFLCGFRVSFFLAYLPYSSREDWKQPWNVSVPGVTV